MPVTTSRSRLRTSRGSKLAAPGAARKWVTASATKVPEPQAGSSTRWFSGSVHQLSRHGAGQPCGGVVFPQLPSLLRRDDRFVERGRSVQRGLSPVESSHSTGQGLQQRVAADLVGPSEEIRFQHTLQPSGAMQLPPLEQVGGVGLGQAANVDAE